MAYNHIADAQRHTNYFFVNDDFYVQMIVDKPNTDYDREAGGSDKVGLGVMFSAKDPNKYPHRLYRQAWKFDFTDASLAMKRRAALYVFNEAQAILDDLLAGRETNCRVDHEPLTGHELPGFGGAN